MINRNHWQLNGDNANILSPKAHIKKAHLTRLNDIGEMGAQDAGVGICPEEILPSYILPMTGTYTPGHDNYGNYKCIIDNSIMCWIPKHYFKYESDNTIDVKGIYDYVTEAEANAAGYALDRAFIDGGEIKEGVFVDKYDWSLTNFVHGVSGMARSIKDANPISSHVDSNRDASNGYAGSFSDCISNGQTPADNYGGAWAVAKSRGDKYAIWSIYIVRMLARLSLAHGQAATSTANCAWYDAAGVTNFPKGNNNYGADYNDPSVTFTACDDSYWASRNEARKTGSGSTFAKTTHNGQNCGVADLNGNQYKIMQGLTSNSMVTKSITAITRAAEAVFSVADITGISDNALIQIQGDESSEWNSLIDNKFLRISDISGNSFKLKANGIYVDSSGLALDYDGSGFSVYYGYKTFLLKEAVALKDVTGGNSLTGSDHFNATFINNNFDEVTIPFEEGRYSFHFGDGSNQVLPFSTDRNTDAYKLASAGLPLSKDSISSSGTNLFGQDYFYQWFLNDLCALAGGYWNYAGSAGVWCLELHSGRTSSYRTASGRSCLYV